MIDFYESLVESLESGQRFAMGTVVGAAGSTPQKAGARAMFFADGRATGTLGGGCLEMEARRRALQSLRTGRAELFELQLDDDFGWDDGLICGGTARILVEPMIGRSPEPYRALLTAMERGQAVALAAVVDSVENGIGGLLAVTADRVVADGMPQALQDAVAGIGRDLLADRRSPAKVRPLPESSAQVYFEPRFPREVLLIVGGGHIGQALCHLAHLLDFDVHVLDDRPDYANHARCPEAVSTIAAPVDFGVRAFPITHDTYVVVVTRGHRHDAIALRECIHSPAAYLGMIGSRRKVHVIFDAMLRDGLATQEELSRVHAPVGLDIGAKSVQEIALSIAAQLVQARHGHDPSRETAGMKRPRIASAGTEG